MRDPALVDNHPVAERLHSDPVALTIDEHRWPSMLSNHIGKGDVEWLATVIGQVRRSVRFGCAWNRISVCHPCPHEPSDSRPDPGPVSMPARVTRIPRWSITQRVLLNTFAKSGILQVAAMSGPGHREPVRESTRR